jgi:hypothetical protein
MPTQKPAYLLEMRSCERVTRECRARTSYTDAPESAEIRVNFDDSDGPIGMVQLSDPTGRP